MCDCCDEVVELSADVPRGTPDQIAPYLRYIYTEEELKLMFAMGTKHCSRIEIAAKMGEDPTALLESAYKRAVIDEVYDEHGHLQGYKTIPAAKRVNNMATFDRDDWEALPEDVRHALSRWHFRQFVEMKRPMGYPGVAAKRNTVMPLEHVIAYMRKTADHVFVIPCDCKSTWGDCPVERRQFCMEFHVEANTAVGRGHGREVTKDEAEELLRWADELGLYHTAEIHGICNCCACCCYPGRTTAELGYTGLWPKIAYQAVREEAQCESCLTCVTRCPKGALVEQDKAVVFDPEKCWGCGLCEGTCKAKVITMQQIK